MRYTVDGTPPTDTSLLYTAPIAVGTGQTVSARAFTADWAPSDVTTATFAFNYGPLPKPIASPAGGSYAEAQTVTLTATAGAAIRYTVDDTLPVTAWPVYVSPFIIDRSSTLLAIAQHPDWTASATVSETYAIADTTPPTITATISPAPNVAGWNFTAVTVSNFCADVQSTVACPAAVTVATDGPDQVVTRTITDAAGLTATATGTVHR